MARGKWALWLAVAALISIGIPAYAGDKDQKPDLTGQWRLDAQHSDMPQRPPGGGGYGGGGGHGGWGGHEGGGYGGGGGGGWGGHEGGGGGHHGGGGGEASAESRPVRLPDLMHVTMTPALVSFEDSTGAVVREVATVSAEADTFAHAPGALHVPGEWKGDKLVIEREGPRGKVTETISLEDKGSTLVLKTKMEGNGEMPSREFKRVYRKVVQSG
jgi:hypothetical protein